MVTKTITVTKEAYDALSREKMDGESFSELALRLANGNGKLRDCFGLWKMTDGELKAFEDVKRSWEDSDRDLVKMHKRLARK
jgi:predicted CopG family antitoxin